MKAYILSLGVHGTHENYGAVLQILAFQEYLNRYFNADVSVINYYGKSVKNNLFLEECYPRRCFKTIEKATRNALKILIRKKMALRVRKHERFISCYLNVTKRYDYKSIEDAKFNSDVFIAESDVIWDPSFRKMGFDKAYFLNNACFKNGKRIVYAASMGDIKYSSKDKNKFLELISGIDCFSVRETYAKEYIEKNLNLHTETLIDPTLLMNHDFYDQYIKGIKRKIKKPYVIVYFPAEINNSVLDSAEKYSLKYDCDVLYLSRTEIENRDTKTEYGIEEFLYYIKHCEAVFCDSFHGICFSIIYRKNFYAFVRDDGMKVVDVCKRFGLEDRIISDGVLSCNAIEYDCVYQLLEIERVKAYSWLTNALAEKM